MYYPRARFELPTRIMRQRLGVPANVAPNTRRTQFINHANYKIIYINVIDWANATKIHTPPSAKHYFPPLTSMRSAKTMSRPERARFRKALKTSLLFFSAYFLQLIAKVRRREHYVPASRLQLLALISSASGE